MKKVLIISTVLILIVSLFAWTARTRYGQSMHSNEIQIIRSDIKTVLVKVSNLKPIVKSVKSVEKTTVPSVPVFPMEDADLPNVPEYADVRLLHEKILHEKSLEPWASSTKERLNNFFAIVPYVRASPNDLQVSCKETICEVYGVFQSDIGYLKTNEGMSRIQTISQSNLHNLQLSTVITTMFQQNPSNAKQTTFVTYFQK